MTLRTLKSREPLAQSSNPNVAFCSTACVVGALRCLPKAIEAACVYHVWRLECPR